jgi:hypothetical protein
MFEELAPKLIDADLNVGGLRDGIRFIHKFGQNPAVGTTDETIWAEGGLYVYPTTQTAMTISSDSANDTSAGTGLQTVTVLGLDGNLAEVTQTVTLQGTNAVTLPTSMLRVFRAYGRAVGSGLVNAGNVYVGTGGLTSGKPATVYASIAAGAGQTQLAFYTIPAGYYGYAYRWNASAGGGKAITLSMYERDLVSGTRESWRVQSNLRFNNTVASKALGIPRRLSAGTDIEIRGLVDTGTTSIESSFDVLLVPTTPNQKWGQTGNT